MKINYYVLSLISFGIFLGCKKETITEAKAGFNYEIINQNFTVPVKVSFVNTSTGAQNYEWTFEGGSPNVSKKKILGLYSSTVLVLIK